MSKITDIVIVTGLDEDSGPGSGVWLLNSLLSEHYELQGTEDCPGAHLKEISDYAGGNKRFCGRIYAASINYLNVEEFVGWAKSAGWAHPACVQLLMQEENESGFKRVDLSNGDD